MRRTLIAGFGNSLRGDDGFGVAVIHRLEELGVGSETWNPGDRIDLLEVGTAGIRMAQDLLTPCDVLIIADAMTRGGEPGTLYVREVDDVEQAESVDMHVAIPSQALSVAKALGVLPPKIIIVGCEPMQVDELTCDLTGELSPPVRLAVAQAVEQILELVPTPLRPAVAEAT